MKTTLLKLMKTVTLAGFLGFVFMGASAQALELNPSASGFVWETHPDSANFNEIANNGDMNVMYSPEDSDSREAYLKFDISEVKEIITSASLTVTGSQKKDELETVFGDKMWDDTIGIHVAVYATKANWTQEDHSWNTKADQLGYPLDTIVVEKGSAQTFVIDNPRFVNYLNGEVTWGSTEVSFAFVAIDPYTNSRVWITND